MQRGKNKGRKCGAEYDGNNKSGFTCTEINTEDKIEAEENGREQRDRC